MVRPTVEQLYQWKKQGKSDKEIALDIGVHTSTVRRWRQESGIPNARIAKIRICQNCQEETSKLKKGMCNTCYEFWRTHRRMRTIGDMKIRNGATGWCIHCRQSRRYALRLCQACYLYQKQHNRSRPRYLWCKYQGCKVCGKPYEKKSRFSRDRCRWCYDFFRRNGRDRTQEEIQENLSFGYCDCGQPATHANVPLTFATGTGLEITETYNLCSDCYALEFDPA